MNPIITKRCSPIEEAIYQDGFQAGATSRDTEIERLRTQINTLTEALEFCSGTSYIDDAHKMANETLALIGSTT